MEITSPNEVVTQTTASQVSEADRLVEEAAKRFHLSSQILERIVMAMGKKDLQRLVRILVEYPLHSDGIRVTESLSKSFELIQDMIVDKNVMLTYTQKQLDEKKAQQQSLEQTEGSN